MAFSTPVAGGIIYAGVGNVLSNIVYPSGIAAGDVVLLVVGQKPSGTTSGGVTTPSGFTLRESYIDGGGYASRAVDQGNTNIWIFSKDTVSGTEGGTTQSVSLTTNNAAFGFFIHVPASVGYVTYGSGNGTQDVTPTSPLTIVLNQDPGFVADDMAVWAMTIATDLNSPSPFVTPSITSSGVTFGTAAQLNTPFSSINNDIGGMSSYAAIVSGTSSGAPTIENTLTGTLTNVRGPMALVRLREGRVATLSGTLEDATVSAVATADIGATLSATLANATLSSTATVVVTATLNQTLDNATLASSTGVLVSATANITLENATLAGVAGVQATATLNKTLDNATLSAVATNQVNATLSKTLENATLAAIAQVGNNATLSATLQDAILSGSADVRVEATLSATLDGATLASLASVDITAALSSTLQDATLQGRAEFPNEVTLNATLQNATLAAVANVTDQIFATLNVTLADATLQSTAFVTDPKPAASRTGKVRRVSRIFKARKTKGQIMVNIGPDGRQWIAHPPITTDLDYGEDWSDALEENEIIIESTWTVPDGITLTRSAIVEDGTMTVVWASGGEDGRLYVMTNTITTNQGRINSVTLTLRCQPQ